jgi:putative cardiolipin synthase
MRSTYLVIGTVALLLATASVADPRVAIDDAIRAHPGLTGSLVLEHGEQALLARAWLVDHARQSIEVQYFIWSTDNIGILASEALLRAAERDVAVRVIVDDLLIDAPDETLLALAAHPNIDIRIYNPMHSVGVPWYRRLWGAVTDFRGSNQRMHDKVLIVDGELAITGGRNMADEYFDYDHDYNFRDRDALVLGSVVSQMRSSFERFWSSDLTVPVERPRASLHVRKLELQSKTNLSPTPTSRGRPSVPKS